MTAATEAAQKRALDLLTPRPPLYCPHAPEVRQSVFILLDELEALYGGAAGGGKSDALLMGASQWVDIPGYAALLLRKTYSELSLPGALMSRSMEWYRGAGIDWNDGTHTWTFPSGATITFGHLQYTKDRYRYSSTEFQFIGFDELTEFKEDEYTFLISRCRRPATGPLSQIPLRVRSGTNPGGIGHDWVKRRFIPEIDPATGAKRFKYDAMTGQLRPFVPARLKDNPHIDQASYINSLQHLDPITRERLLNGDWDIHVGGMFSRLWFKIAPVSPLTHTVLKRVRYWDLASTEESPGSDPDYTVGCRQEWDTNHDIYITDLIRGRWGAMDVEARILQTAHADGRHVPVYIEREPGASSKLWIDYLVRQLPGYVVIPIPSRGDKKERAAPFASYAQAGHVYLVEGPWLPEFLAELEAFDGETSPHDDQVDAASGAFAAITMAGAVAQSHSTIPGAREPVYRKGDLVLRGERYVDKEPIKYAR